ncbi:MAG: hypothetical protein KKA07_04440, partial [Bacteroidetes bacterium]|nr:hypothetical protein [Bacteroidota bacterium]
GTFYDNGGSAGSYSSSLNKTMYFNSDNGNKIKFTFTAFSLYGDGYDYLEIFDGPSTSSPLIGKYYSTSNPGVIESSGTSLTFHFYSNSSYSGTGWTADIECTTPPMLDVPMTSGSVTTCYAIFSDNGGTSADYPNNENREMTFSSGSSEYIIFDFTHFNVASGDTLFAYDGTDTNAPIIGAYTGTGIPEKIYSESGNSVTFKFTSNATTVAAGWRAVVYCDTVPPALEYTMADGYRYTCDGTFYDDGGASSYYSSSTTRTLTLFSENNHRVSLNFQTFFLYNDGYDYVEIYDGPTVSHYRIGKYMSNSSPGIVTSTGNCLTIKSYANSSYAFPGWEAAISCTDTALTTYILAEDSVSTCEAVFCDPGGPMANYLHNDDQTTTFYPDGGNYIIFDFQTFDVIADDTLYAFDGEDISAPLIGKYYGNNLPEKIYNKTGDAVTFRFVTGVSNAGAGWRAMISCSSTPPTQIFNIQSGVRYTCGGTFYDPGGTAYYHANDYEIMTFVSDNGNRIAFDFQSFTTETGYDYLYIYDGPTTSHPLIGTYSGSAAPGIVQSTGTSLTFRFNSDGSNQYSGFMANISCTTPPLTAYIMSSGTVNTCSGIFYDNGGPAANYPHNENRTQTFCSDNGQYIIFDFTHSSISTDDTLYVHDGASTADPLIGVYTGSYLPEKIWSKSGTCVTFRFVSGTTNNSSGWRALISCSAVAPTPAFTMQQGIRYTCGGTFLDQGGSGYYSNSLSQTMTYHSENGNRLQFNFLSFSTETGYDKLYVYDGPNNSYPIIGTYSGSSSPGTVTSTGDALTFYFNCDGSNQYPGWSASISCAGAVLPEYPLTPGVISDCEGVFYDSGGPAANYANSEDITETFCSDNGQLVKFIFLPLNFSLITGDSLYVFDGADINAAPLAIYTGGSFADTLVSSGTCLTFRFKSDASSVSSGWKAMLGCTSVPAVPHIYNMSSGVRYTCDGYFTDSGGSGGYYGASENKTMTFISAAGDNCGIRFNFSSFSTETGYDKLYIYDGPSTSSTLIGTYSGGTLPGTAGEVQGTGNALTFRFTSDGSNQYSGWFATISCPGQTAAPTVTNNSPVCSGDTLKLMAADITGATYFWTGPNGFTSMAQDTFIFPTTAADAGIYSVVATVSGCSSNSGYTQAIIHDPANTATTVSGPVCEGGILQLSTSDVTGAAFTWSGPNGFSSSLREPSITNVTTDASGWYYVSVVVGTCTVEDSVQATVNPSPDAMNPLSSGTVCEGSNVNLSVTGTTGANYLWTGPDGFSSNDEDPVLSSVTISSEGWYYVTATLGLCSINDSVEVSIDAAYTAPVIWTNGPLCEAENLYLQSSFVSGVSYLWNNPDIDSIANTQNAWVINVAISDTGWYYLETERGTCALTDSIHVAISQHPTNPALAAQFDACEGQDLTIPIVGTVGATYSWTGPNGYTSSDEDAVVSGIAMADAGNYYLEVSTGACSFTDSTEVVVNQTPVISAISSNSPICSSDTLQLFSTTSGGSEFAWTGPNSFISDVEDPMIIYPSVAFNGWYYLTVTAGACSTLDSAVITIEQAPENPAVTSNYNPLCTGDNLELYAVPTTAATYEWSGPGGYTSTDQNPVINSIGSADAGTYYVTVTYGNCTATDNIDIQVYDMPVTVNLVTNAPVCGHDTLTVDADHVTGASYLWNGPMSYTNNNEDMVFEDPMPFNTGYYVVEVSIGGCSLLDSVYAEIYAVPDNPDIQADITLCAGETLAFTITETASATYAWTGPNGFNSTEISPSISNVTTAGDGIYTVVATLGTCTATDNIDIQIDELPATLNLATNGPVCAYNALNISSDNITGAAYAWTGPNGFTSSQEDPVIASPVTANTGYYVVEVSLGACAMSDSVYAVVNDGPANPNIQATTPLCASNTLIFAITETAGADYVWSGPNGFSSALAEPEIFGVTTAASGVYSITATIGSCSETDQISVTVNTAPPVPVVSNDGPVCEGDIVHLSATNVTGFDYDWYGPNGFHSFSSSTTIYSVELADSGVYTFIVNQGSCSSSASTTVQVYPVPAVPAIILNGTILEAPAGYAAYEWYYNYGFTPVG